MKAIILVDSGRKYKKLRKLIFDNINSYLENKSDIEIVDISSMSLKECVGCFNCWVRTPGLCNSEVNNDLNYKIINSDNLIIVSEMTYGGFSASSKKVIDKLLPNVLPHMTIINSEIHHVKRYKNYPNFLSIAYADEISVKYSTLFNSITTAMGYNFHSNKVESFIIDSSFEMNKLSNVLDDFIGRE